VTERDISRICTHCGLFKALPEGLALCDLEGEILAVNAKLRELVGANPGEMTGKYMAELFCGNSWPAIQEALARVVARHEARDIRADSLASRPICLSFSLVRRAEASQPLILLSVKDITRENHLADELNRTQSEGESLLAELDEASRQLKEAQNELLRKERLEVSGELAARVAHEIRNPLAIIGMSAQYLHAKLGPGHALCEFTTAIANKVKQLDAITTQLINLGRPRKLKLEAKDLHRTLNQVLRLASCKCLAQRVRIAKHLDRRPCPVTCDHNLLSEVITNLVTNAVDAMVKGGVLTVETRFDRQENQAIVRITDTGCGIPLRAQAQLCKPFFTTKRGGTGLGLAISQRIIDFHHGSLSCISKTRGPQRGTTFTIRIPITPRQQEQSTG
jgi:PAS domain S-box-containing protein